LLQIPLIASAPARHSRVHAATRRRRTCDRGLRFYDSNRRCYHPVGAEVEVMNRPLVVFLVAFALVTVAPLFAAQDSCDKQFVVSQVDLRTTTHLSRSELAAIRARLIALCFDDQQLGELAVTARDTLLSLGYLGDCFPTRHNNRRRQSTSTSRFGECRIRGRRTL
jgi:hypothetical protein